MDTTVIIITSFSLWVLEPRNTHVVGAYAYNGVLLRLLYTATAAAIHILSAVTIIVFPSKSHRHAHIFHRNRRF